MTEVGATATSHHHRHHRYYHSAPTGPLTRSAMAMAARPAGVSGVSGAAAAREEALAGPRVSETSPTSAGAGGAPLSSASSVSSSSSSSATTTAPAGPPSPASPSPGPASSGSPRRPITKKRAASINTEEANRPKIEHLSLTTPSTASPRPFDTSNAFICLCTPPPKVPRPRNAFILYRQHHQSEVVQQNPGLANPDISKIIGEKWREEPEERKSLWKQLAEEEKQRHQRQYPDYRYQPRRGNKAGGGGGSTSGHASHSARPAAPGEDPHRCAKCGGRYIATPRTPSTPFMTPTSASSSNNKPGNNAPYGPPFPSRADNNNSNNNMAAGRYGPGGGRPVHWGSGSLHDIREDYDNHPPLVEAKRRRVTASAAGSVPGGGGGGGGGSYHNFHALPSPPPAASAFPHHQQQQRQQQRHASFSNPPTPGGYAPPPSVMRTDPGPMMPPPPRPPHSLPTGGGGGHYPVPHHFAPRSGVTPAGAGSDFDESLRLPPLQTRHLDNTTTNAPPPPPATPSDPGTAAPATATSVINPTWHHVAHHHPHPHHPHHPAAPNPASASALQHNRAPSPRDQSAAASASASAAAAKSVEAMVMSISFLSKLRVLDRISPRLAAGASRGPVVAVEGADARAVKAVAGVVERALRHAEAGWEVRCWEDETEKSDRRESVDGFTGYLRAITEWHGKSAEITQFVTGAGGGGGGGGGGPRLSTSSASSSGTTSTATPSTTTSSTDPNATDSDVPTPRARQSLPTQPPSSSTNQPEHALPIALLPAGFSLTLADRFACAVPISDAYAPVDHWQWMATLWRGVVAPDLVVYVTGAGGKAGEEGVGGGVGGGQGQAQVEVCDAGLMVVRVPVSGEAMESAAAASSASSSSFPGAVVVVDEKMERRLGFEVVEWVRGGGWVGHRRGEGYPSSAGLMES